MERTRILAPDCKFDKQSREAMTELKSTSRKTNKNSTSFNSVQLPTNEPEFEADKSKEEVWCLDPSRYSKWYKVKLKGELEVGLSLVRVRSWVQRFVNNCRRSVGQRRTGELTPAKLLATEEEITKKPKVKHSVMKSQVLGRTSPFCGSLPYFPSRQSLSRGSYVQIPGCDIRKNYRPMSNFPLFCQRRAISLD